MSVVTFTHSISTFSALIRQIAYASRQKMLEANMRKDTIPMLCNGFVLDKFADMVEFAKTFMLDPRKNDRIGARVRGVVFSLKDLIVQNGVRTDIDTTNQCLLHSTLETIGKYYPHHSYMLTIHNNTIHPHIHCYIAAINHNDDRDYFTNRYRETNHSLEFIQSLNRHFNNEIAKYDDHHTQKPNNLVNALSLADYKEFYQALDENKPLIVSGYGLDTYNHLNANLLRYFIEFEMEDQEQETREKEGGEKERPNRANKKLGRFYFKEFKNLIPYLHKGKKIRLTRAKRKRRIAHKKKLKMTKNERFVLKETTEFIVTIDRQKYRLKNSLKKQLVKKKRLSHVFARIKSDKVKQAQKDQYKRLLIQKAPFRPQEPTKQKEIVGQPVKQPPTNPVINATKEPMKESTPIVPMPEVGGGVIKRL
ncbi:hypothetical protein HMPREF1430_00238 [Helicobacter pylori GAM96Ai]|uniref:hypothetical protein n=1 Tax=Helicobacter pylori TaxID=210 RepID=UPI0002BC1416|nr:hypothetical protein [Helicobacter pylori]EMH44823.1 hypothetical protein HMPREF1430_00238 [Helicobacter pylori GAM96Ai]